MDALLSVPGLWRLEREVVDRVIQAGLGESARGFAFAQRRMERR